MQIHARGDAPALLMQLPPAIAEPLFEQFKDALVSYGLTVASGIFGASMKIDLCNEGPVTLMLDSEEL